MGTNYYLITSPCDHCGKGQEKCHLGKASGGWHFSFRGYREDENFLLPPGVQKVESIKEWKALVKLGTVEDEYGGRLSARAMTNLALTWGEKGDKFHAKYMMDKYPGSSDRMIDGHSFTFVEFS